MEKLIELDNATSDGTFLGTVKLLHAPEAKKVRALRAAMRRDGWKGRPVVLASREDGIHALSGCHRLSAVRNLPIAIPAVWLPADLTADQWDRIEWAVFDYERLKIFRELAEERDEDWDDVISVMYIEAHGQT